MIGVEDLDRVELSATVDRLLFLGHQMWEVTLDPDSAAYFLVSHLLRGA